MAGWVTVTLMLWRMARRGIYHLSMPLLRRLAAQFVAAALMGWALYEAARVPPPLTPADSLSALAVWLGVFMPAAHWFMACRHCFGWIAAR